MDELLKPITPQQGAKIRALIREYSTDSADEAMLLEMLLGPDIETVSLLDSTTPGEPDEEALEEDPLDSAA